MKPRNIIAWVSNCAQFFKLDNIMAFDGMNWFIYISYNLNLSPLYDIYAYFSFRVMNTPCNFVMKYLVIGINFKFQFFLIFDFYFHAL